MANAMGNLEWQPAAKRADLLAGPVAAPLGRWDEVTLEYGGGWPILVGEVGGGVRRSKLLPGKTVADLPGAEVLALALAR